MSNNLNKLSKSILAKKDIVFYLLMLMVLVDRMNIFFRFSIQYTDSDQTVMWQISKNLMNGIFHGPCFYGQSYNPIIEPLFSLPFLYMGMEYSTALPLVTTLMSIIPFIMLSIYLYKKVDTLVGTIPLFVLLLLSIEYEMLTSISRGFVTGIFFATLGFTSITFHNSKLAKFIGGLLLGIGLYSNPNCVLLIPLLLPFITLSKDNFYKICIPILIGFSIGVSLIVVNSWFYRLNPDLIIHASPSLKTSFSSFLKIINNLNNYFDFVTPIFWRAGWLVLSIFFIVGIRTWRYGFKKESVTIFISLIFIVVSFFFTKVSDGTNSVFFSGSRMFLAYPIIIIITLTFLIKTLNEVTKGFFYSSLIILSLISFTVKLAGFDALLNHALRGSAYSVVQVAKVKELKSECEEMIYFNEKKTDLILSISPNTQDQIITYGCPCLINDFPTTFQPAYERRTWLFRSTRDIIYPTILIHGKRLESWNKINMKKLTITHSDKTKRWLLIKNKLKTRDLLTTMNITN